MRAPGTPLVEAVRELPRRGSFQIETRAAQTSKCRRPAYPALNLEPRYGREIALSAC